MLRLSQRAWNNVVILAMLFMVYLFTLSNDMINNDESAPAELVPLFPDYSIVMTLDFGIVRLERIGQAWRVKGESRADPDDLARISENWSKLEVRQTTKKPEQAPYIVSVLLAGEDKKRVFQLFPENNALILQSNGDFYLIDEGNIDSFYPVSLLESSPFHE